MAQLPPSAARTQFTLAYAPGELEMLLTADPNSVLSSQTIGKLEGPGSAIFTGVIAQDPVSTKKVKGLRIDLDNGERKRAVYLDESSLMEFQRRMREARKTQQHIMEHTQDYVASSPARRTSIAAVQRSPRDGKFFGVLTAGYYWHENGFGAYVEALGWKQDGAMEVRFPDIDLSEVENIIAGCRAYLGAN
jgi:hypothetical protein